MEIHYNKSVMNEKSRKESKKEHEANEKWKNFAQRAQKNPFVKAYLMNKYNGICQYCGLPIRKNLQLQHKTYDKECITDSLIRVLSPTPKRPNATRCVPDCEHCEQFHECIDDALFPVHAFCNHKMACDMKDKIFYKSKAS